MNNNYKAIVSNKELYTEIELQQDEQFVRVGTVPGCNVRLNRKQFFSDFWICFSNTGDTWRISCSENIYVYAGDVRKLTNKLLQNGETISIRYQESNASLFFIEFVVDFNNEQRKYQRVIDIRNNALISIGTDYSNHIALRSIYAPNENVILKKTQNGYELNPLKSTYGVYLNGSKINQNTLVKDTDFFSIADFIFYYRNGLLWTEVRKDIQINGIAYWDRSDINSYPRFVRNTREKIEVNTEKIEVLDPPNKPSKPRNHILTSLLPSMGMLATSGMMATMGRSMIAYSIVSGGMSIVLAVATLIQNNVDYKKDLLKREEQYHAYEARKRNEINTLRENERAELELIYIDSAELEKRIDEFSRDLFDRMPDDKDFLDVRLGLGTVKALREIEIKKQERIETDDDLCEIPHQIAEDFKLLDEIPVVCHLKEANAIGIIGAEVYRYEMMKNILYDLCTRQYLDDIALFFIAKPEHASRIEKLRNLPQVNNPKVGFRCIAYEDEGKNRVFDILYQALSERKSEEKAEHIIVFFYDEYGFQTHPASKYLLEAQNHHATFVFMADKKGDIPTGCSQHIYVDSRSTGYIVNTSDKSESVQFYYRPISEQKLEHLVTVLAPVYTEELSLESSLTKSISLFELLNIVAADDLNLQSRWNTSKVYESMSAPIGVTRSGVIYLDLHDKAHGPHGLVAGTTGSGKSELLQTYILSIATYYHPYEVGFVIIDFKGGGMVNQFKDLPHLLGAITNIDGKEIDRSLRFIKAELKKRQRLFAEANVNHIDKYIKLYKSGSVDIPLPHLILIVDEFAELKADQPEFMQELISAARIGRSLGVHLILATQKPSGQVDDQIWSNSKFKLCLKVQNQEDSNEVLKSPLAAEIKEPGRAYLQVGNNEIFELLQSAYSGAPERTGDTSTKEFSIYEVTQSGRRRNVFTQKRNIVGDSDRTQLDAIVDYVRDFFENSGQLRLPGICLPPLERVIAHPGNALSGDLVDIGIYDDPDNQYQGKTYLDFDNKNTFILGSSQYGKTNLLISVIRSIASAKGADQSIFYILDFGSMILKNFENMKHVGGVVCSSEDEKLKNLLKMLFEEINNRKEKLLSAGVGSFASYIEAGYTDLPHIYLVVDNMTAAMELYFEEDESLLTLIREGLAVGISTIVANVQTAGISYRYMSNFANRVAFYCNDSSEYMSLFDHSTVCPDELPGRCLIEIDKRIYECQTYIAFAGEKEIDRIKEIRAFVDLINAKDTASQARKIPCIPDVLTTDILNSEFKASINHYKVPIGLSYEEVVPISIDLACLGIMGLCGGTSENRRGFVEYLFAALKQQEKNVETIIIDDVSREYALYQECPFVTMYTLNIDVIQDVLERWYVELEERYNHLLSGENAESDDRLLLLIVNNNDVAKKIDNDYELNDRFNEMVTRYRNLNLAIIFTNYQNVAVSYDAPAPLLKIRDDRHLIYFEALDKLKPFDVPYEIIKRNRRQLEKGDAFYICEESYMKLKLVT